MLIKVCGMRDPENIRAVESLGIDLMGFIFYPKSPRYCAQVPSYLPTRCRRVGVFVNAPDAFIASRISAFHLDILQLHGDETAERVAEIKARFRLPVINALNWPCDKAAGNGDLLLFETKCSTYGGSGQQFDWSILQDYHGETPFLLTGGIGPDDAERIKAFRHQKFAGIDLNSKFETAPGLKDVESLRRFLDEINNLPK